MYKTAVVTGAGSGVGRAVALALAAEGWRVALVGRREGALKETASLAEAPVSSLLVLPCDVREAGVVEEAAATVLSEFGSLQVLVNAAGTNVPARSLRELSLEHYHTLLDTNLNGAYYLCRAFLPIMREQGSGTIVNVVSEAGKRASAKAGPAYVISKFGLAGLTQAINAEERVSGVRACAIFPGDIATPLLDLRPSPPPAEARSAMLQAQDVAECVMLAIRLPARAVIEEIVVRPGGRWT